MSLISESVATSFGVFRLSLTLPELKTATNQSIFSLQAGVTSLFREYLESKGFMEIHSPKLQAAATESGASVFKVSYFKGAKIIYLFSSQP